MIVIGDIHGNFNTFMALLDMIPQEEKDKGIVISGDLIDRGPKSMQVVQWCIDNKDKVQVTKGNHEEMMVNWNINGCSYRDTLWINNGGLNTLDSYRKEYKNTQLESDVDWELFDKHCNFMNLLPYYLEFPDVKNSDGRYLVVSHSNINNVWSLRNTIEEKDRKRFVFETIWGRPYKIKDVPEIYNIVGHTIQENGPRIRKNYSCIDTGCFYTRGGYGRLTALQFPEMIIYEHENIDSKIGRVTFKRISTPEDVKRRKQGKYVK